MFGIIINIDFKCLAGRVASLECSAGLPHCSYLSVGQTGRPTSTKNIDDI